MHCYIDLRYVIPPFTNLLFMLLHSYVEPCCRDDGPLSTDDHLIAKLAFLLVMAILVLIFLLTSVKLPFNVTVATDAIRFQAGDFSAALAIGLLCSIFLTLPHFWFSYPIIIAISPWYASIFNLFKRFLYWFYQILQSIPTINAIFFTQQEEHEHPQQESSQVEVQLAEIEGDHLQEQPSFGMDFAVVIDGSMSSQ